MQAQPTPAPQQMPQQPQLEQAPPFMMFNGGAAFDPNALPLPPEIGPAVFGWVRRLALQADLTSADRLLRDAIADLTSSLSVVVIYAGPDGFYSLGPDGEMPKDQTPILAVGKSRRALVGPHSGFIPIATATETIAVIQLVRNARQPAFGEAEYLTMAAIARECAAVLHHLVVQHLQGRHEHQLDQKSLYRPEALQYHRKKGSEGVVTQLSPGWVRRAYPVLAISLTVALVAGIVLRVPTYSSGFGMIKYPSTPVVSQTSGNVDKMYVRAGDIVHVGQPLLKLSSQKEDADYLQYKVEAENAIFTFLADDQDDQAKKSVRSATAALAHSQAQQDQRVIRANADGRISDLHTGEGEPVQPGAQLMSIIKPGTLPEVWAYLPATDRPRIKRTMDIQVEVTGFRAKRAHLPIKYISMEAVGAAEVRRELGQQLADAVKVAPESSYTLVRATFPIDTIKVGKKTFELHEGMATKVDIQIENRPFLSTVFPLFEKYFD
ncbi:MAG: HlyD family efflux transporter periplasmic adaptor subunit [Kofleriaceae bacterium]